MTNLPDALQAGEEFRILNLPTACPAWPNGCSGQQNLTSQTDPLLTAIFDLEIMKSKINLRISISTRLLFELKQMKLCESLWVRMTIYDLRFTIYDLRFTVYSLQPAPMERSE